MLDDPGHDRLIDTIYRCALERADWSNVCDLVVEVLPEMGCVLHLHDEHDSRNVGVSQAGYDAAAVMPYIAEWARRNPYIPHIERLTPGVLAHARDLVPTDEYLRTPFWNEWMRPQGDFAGGSAVVLSRDNGRYATIALNYPHRSPAREAEADAMLMRIAPHLQRAFSMWRRATADHERLTVVESCLGAIPTPVAIVDAHRRVRFASDALETILRRMDGLALCARHELRALDKGADETLGRAIAQIADRPRMLPPLVMVPKTRGRSDEPRRHYVVSAFPLPQDREDLGFGGFSFFDGTLVALMVHDPDAAPRIDPRRFGDAFGLTPSESMLAAAMLDGATVADYAKARSVSRYTVRNQLSSIMRKTGTARQTDLVALLTRIAITS
ncbi:MAG: helix-turn-helix transcriptional regulator [Hasllibacter sp.]